MRSQQAFEDRSRRLKSAGLILTSAAMVLLLAGAITATPAGAASVTPQVWCNQADDVNDPPGCDVISQGGNPTCADLGLTTLNSGFDRNPDNGIPFSWTSTVPVGAVIVKGGPTANVYIYPPGTMSDTNLTTPTNPSNGNPYGLSHILMCAGEAVAPDLGITKSASSTQVNGGGAFSYTITVQNTGEADATGVVVSDDLHDAFTAVSATFDGPGANDVPCTVGAGNQITCNIGTLGPNQSATVTINATAPDLPLTPGGDCTRQYHNQATVDSNQTEPETSNQVTVTVTGTGCEETPSLNITKNASATQVNEGGAFSYTITVQNTGDASATNVVVTDDLDDNLTGVSASASQGTCDPVGLPGNTIECELGTIAGGASATVTINATAPQLPLPGTNVCQISIANTAFVDSTETDKVSDDAPLVTVTGTGCNGGGGGGGGTPTPTTPTPTTIAPTTVTPAPPPDDDTTPPETSVEPTTVAPGGTAFTGPEDVIPLGVIALTLMTTGSGLLWAGSRLSRREDDDS